MTAPVLWSDLQVAGQPPVPMTEDVWDANFLGLDGRVRAIEDLRDGTRGIGDLPVVRDGQAVSVPLTDGSGADPHNLALAKFEPRGDWTTGTTYARGDLVTVGSRSAVATVDHTAAAWADDLAAGRWTLNVAGADWLRNRGVYDPAAAYAVGDAVLYSTDGLRWGLWRGAVRDADTGPLPVGSAPGSVDAAGFPHWSQETVAVRARQLTLRPPGGGFAPSISAGRVAARRLALPISIPLGWAGSGGTIQPAPSSAKAFEIRVDGVAVATLTFPAKAIQAILVGAGSLLVGVGSVVELWNTGPAINGSTISVGIAGTHV